MKRKIYEKLLEWKNRSNGRSSLLIEGARRVGKSYIVREFAENEYERHLIIDFVQAQNAIKRLFNEKLDNLDEFFLLLQSRTGCSLIPGKTLIVFDEVQRFPRAREALKYLVEDGRFHYIETGSLISIKRNVQNIMLPSEEEVLRLFPMDFEEFLWAIGRNGTMELIRDRLSRGLPMGQSDHREVMNLFRQYFVVGGMPQAVEAFANGCDLVAAEEFKRKILNLYAGDIGKFSGRLDVKVRAIWKLIPEILTSHERLLRPGKIGDGVRMRELYAPLEWLEESMTVNLSRASASPNIGLRLFEDSSKVKCYLGDTGLLMTMTFNENSKASVDVARRILNGKIEINKGMLMENMVAQMLKAAGQELFFYRNSGGNDSKEKMEIDFLLARTKVGRRNNIVPIEVKSAKDYTTVSLDRFKAKFAQYVSRPIVLHPGDFRDDGQRLYFPLYMASLIPELPL